MNPSPSIYIDVKRELAEGVTVHKSLDQEIILTTVDKVKLCLMRNRETLYTKRMWVTPLTLFVTIVATLSAATFKKCWLEASVWKAMFIMGALGSLIWLIVSACKAWSNRGAGGIDQIIAEMKEHQKDVAVTDA